MNDANAAKPAHAPSTIGVFDSGFGGLTVLRALIERLPDARFAFLGDTARLPYGSKSQRTISRYAAESAQFLVREQGAEFLVIACNTASALALDAIQDAVSVPVLGVIEPGADAARAASQTGDVLVIATEATVHSHAYSAACQARGLRALEKACPLLVPLVEEGWTDNDIAERTVTHYLESLKASGIDTLLLGCTHYPLLRGMFERVMGPRVKMVDSAIATAGAVAEKLKELKLARRDGGGAQSFFVTETPERFVRVGRRFIGPRVESAVRIER